MFGETNKKKKEIFSFQHSLSFFAARKNSKTAMSCCFCLCAPADGEQLAQYCKQCNAELHPECLCQILNETANNLEAQPFVEHRGESSSSSSNNGEKSTNAKEFYMFPSAVEPLLRLLLYRKFFTNNAIMMTRRVIIGADRAVLSREGTLINVFPAQDEKLTAAQSLPTSTWNESHNVGFHVVPVSKCIQCRHETPFYGDSDADTSSFSSSSDFGSKGVSWLVFLCYLLHLWLATFAMLFLHRVLTFHGFGIWTLLAPASTFLYSLSWTMFAAPVVVFWPQFVDEIQSICYKQRRLFLMKNEEFLKHAQNLAQAGKESTFLLPAQLHVGNQFHTAVLDWLLPMQIYTVFATTQGLMCARAFWTNADIVSSTDSLSSLSFQLSRTSKTTIVVAKGKHRSAKPQQTQTLTGRLTVWTAGMVAMLGSVGIIGGPSVQTIIVLYALAMSPSLAWTWFAFLIILETIRLSFYSYFAWIWLPKVMPRFVLTRNNFLNNCCLTVKTSISNE